MLKANPIFALITTLIIMLTTQLRVYASLAPAFGDKMPYQESTISSEKLSRLGKVSISGQCVREYHDFYFSFDMEAPDAFTEVVDIWIDYDFDNAFFHCVTEETVTRLTSNKEQVINRTEIYANVSHVYIIPEYIISEFNDQHYLYIAQHAMLAALKPMTEDIVNSIDLHSGLTISEPDEGEQLLVLGYDDTPPGYYDEYVLFLLAEYTLKAPRGATLSSKVVEPLYVKYTFNKNTLDLISMSAEYTLEITSTVEADASILRDESVASYLMDYYLNVNIVDYDADFESVIPQSVLENAYTFELPIS